MPDKPIVIEYVGGPDDGRVLRSNSADGESCGLFYRLSDEGKIGTRFRGIPYVTVEVLRDDSKARDKVIWHEYEVIGRDEKDETRIRVRQV